MIDHINIHDLSPATRNMLMEAIEADLAIDCKTWLSISMDSFDYNMWCRDMQIYLRELAAADVKLTQ